MDYVANVVGPVYETMTGLLEHNPGIKSVQAVGGSGYIVSVTKANAEDARSYIDRVFGPRYTIDDLQARRPRFWVVYNPDSEKDPNVDPWDVLVADGRGVPACITTAATREKAEALAANPDVHILRMAEEYEALRMPEVKVELTIVPCTWVDREQAKRLIEQGIEMTFDGSGSLGTVASITFPQQ